MNKASTDYDEIDFSDLNFDVQRHHEALLSFTRIGIAANSVKPALRARDVVLVRFPSDRFLIGVTAHLSGQESREKTHDGTHFETIHEASREKEAGEIRTEVERYFRRHFPGRVLSGDQSVNLPEGTATYFVFVACYAPI